MDKPTSLIIKELKEGIVKQINESKLPLCVVEMIVKDIHSVIQKEATRIYFSEKKEYDDSQKEV